MATDRSKWHIITEPYEDTKTGDCSICGLDVKIYKKAQKQGRVNWACLTARRAKNRGYALKTRYKLTLDEFDRLLEAQGNCCALCKRSMKDYVVDHDHTCCPEQTTCGKCVRAIVCIYCNVMLGHIERNSLDLQAVSRYLTGSEL